MDRLLKRYEDEALGACHKAAQNSLLGGEFVSVYCVQAAVFCERYARAIAERAIEEMSPAWASVWRVWHEAAIEWMTLANVRDSGHSGVQEE